MNFRTIADMNQLINNKITMIPHDVDLVIGVPRSGIVPAAIISLLMNCQLADIDSVAKGGIYSCGFSKNNGTWITDIKKARKILLVEDSVLSGRSLSEALRKLEHLQIRDKIITFCVYVVSGSKKIPDIYMEVVPTPRMFEWNYLHHEGLAEACFDIDGVLCRDPSADENDDGERYRKFLLNAEAKYHPTVPVGYLVTSRLEKYRKETEQWLKDNRIAYGKLIMMPLDSMEERQRLNNHAEFKASYYKKVKTSMLFVESEPLQALAISQLTSKPVYCTGDQHFYKGHGFYGGQNIARTKMRLKELILKIPIAYKLNQLRKRDGHAHGTK